MISEPTDYKQRVVERLEGAFKPDQETSYPILIINNERDPTTPMQA